MVPYFTSCGRASSGRCRASWRRRLVALGLLVGGEDEAALDLLQLQVQRHVSARFARRRAAAPERAASGTRTLAPTAWRHRLFEASSGQRVRFEFVAGREQERCSMALRSSRTLQPVVAAQNLHGVCIDRLEPLHLGVELTQKMRHQRFDIFAPFAQRRDEILDDVDAEVQVCRKRPVAISVFRSRLVAKIMRRRCGWFRCRQRARTPVPAAREAV